VKKNFQKNYVLVKFRPQNLFFKILFLKKKLSKKNHVVLAMASKSFFKILFHMQKKVEFVFFSKKN